jgi:hypothetical protein
MLKLLLLKLLLLLLKLLLLLLLLLLHRNQHGMLLLQSFQFISQLRRRPAPGAALRCLHSSSKPPLENRGGVRLLAAGRTRLLTRRGLRFGAQYSIAQAKGFLNDG